MRCLNCGFFSISFICNSCKKVLQEYSLQKRQINGLSIYSFYNYSDIKTLLHSKHHLHGIFVYKSLANLSFKNFTNSFNFVEQILAVPIDDNIKSGYSHTAILANSLRSKEIKPSFNTLRANSNVTYSGKNLDYRLKHKRDFKILKNIQKPIILVDDIITTGITINEAYEICKKSNITVLFALTLANAKE